MSKPLLIATDIFANVHLENDEDSVCISLCINCFLTSCMFCRIKLPTLAEINIFGDVLYAFQN